MPTSFISSPLNRLGCLVGGRSYKEISHLDYPKEENSWMDEYLDFTVIEDYLCP